MEALVITLTLSVVISFMFFLVGGMIGWLARDYVFRRQTEFVPTHPEMFDENGQFIPEEVMSIRFENPEDFHYDDE